MAEVRNTLMTDLDEVFRLFESSIRYQEERGYNSWRNYDRSAVIRDIESKNHYKIVSGDKIVIVFSVCYSDKIIWRHRETGDSLYLHRIVVNPEFKGQRSFGVILEWAIQHGKERGIAKIRMDTWADNAKIIAYYQGFGFEWIENYTTPNTLELPVHNRNLPLALLEYRG